MMMSLASQLAICALSCVFLRLVRSIKEQIGFRSVIYCPGKGRLQSELASQLSLVHNNPYKYYARIISNELICSQAPACLQKGARGGTESALIVSRRRLQCHTTLLHMSSKQPWFQICSRDQLLTRSRSQRLHTHTHTKREERSKQFSRVWDDLRDTGECDRGTGALGCRRFVIRSCTFLNPHVSSFPFDL